LIKTFLDKNRNHIIGYGLWLTAGLFAFVPLSALVALLTRLFTYFWAGGDVPRLLLLLRQFFILPLGIAYLVLIQLAFAVVSKHADNRPERVWRFYTWLIAVEFAILYLAARI
jgi:hypothetical protein